MIITSDNEKELPDALLRRCFPHNIRFPDADTPARMVDVHLPGIRGEPVHEAWTAFFHLREAPGIKKKPSTSELIDRLMLPLAEDIPLDVLSEKYAKQRSRRLTARC